MKPHKQQLINGFSLIELCIVLIIAGILLSGGLRMTLGSRGNSQNDTTAEALEKVSNAIDLYVFARGHLPCPAPFAAAVESPEYARQGECAEALKKITGQGLKNREIMKNLVYTPGRDGLVVVTGLLPSRDINLPDSELYDPWGTVLTYSVTLNLTKIESYVQSGGGIFVEDMYGNPVTSPAGGSQYVVVSHGPDRDALSPSGDEPACKKNERDDENCNGDARYIASTLSDVPGPGYYDDVIAYTVWIDPPVKGVPQDCRLEHAAYTLGEKYKALGEQISKHPETTISDGQIVKVCNDEEKDKDCEYFVCKQGRFINGEINLNEMIQ